MTQQISTHVSDWCTTNGYTDPFLQEGCWWAFPPNGVMPLPLEIRALGSLPSFTRLLIVVTFDAVQRACAHLNQIPERLSELDLPSVREFNRGLTDANAASGISLSALGIRSPIIDNRLTSPSATASNEAAAAAAAAAALASFSLTASDSLEAAFRSTSMAGQMQSLVQKIRYVTRLALSDVPGNPRKATIALLVSRHRMKRTIAQIRLSEFCDRYSLADRTAYKLLREGKIRVKHGVLLCGSGFPKKQRSEFVTSA